MDTDLALVLTGGGARGAYQVGVLRYLASQYPELAPGILTGVSAGGIIATHLASHPGTFEESVAELAALWRDLHIREVFRANSLDLSSRVTRWGLRLVGGGLPGSPRARSLVDTAPLRDLLTRTLRATPEGVIAGIGRRLEAGTLTAVALTASSYSTGQSVTWVQNVEGCRVMTFEHPHRTSVPGLLRVDHVLASSALPFFFPAVNIDGAWYGDGGIRLTAPQQRRIQASYQHFGRCRRERILIRLDGISRPVRAHVDVADEGTCRLEVAILLLQLLGCRDSGVHTVRLQIHHHIILVELIVTRTGGQSFLDQVACLFVVAGLYIKAFQCAPR